jgi:hypothetical protein
MAEWLFTEILDRDKSALRGAGHGSHADLGPFKSLLANRSQNVRDSHYCENDQEEHYENEFSGDQRAHKIELQNEKRGSNGHESLSHFRFSNQIPCECL